MNNIKKGLVITMLSGAQAIVRSLEAEGVTTVFGYPGAAICPFLDELEGSTVGYILVRHEQSAGHAANGYARMTGRPGVCFATSGPGATNLITSLATAYMDSIPLIAITGQVSSDLIGRDVFQEADITGAAEPFCKHSYLVKDASSLPRIFKEAFYIASSGRPGPVLIDIPVDIQQAKLEFTYPETVDIRGYKPSFKGHALQIKRVVQSIAKAKNPVICAGGGIFAAGASVQLAALVEKCNIPVVTTMMGIGALPTAHHLNLGMLGTHGVTSANRAIHEADLLIIVGGRVGDRAMAAPGQIAARTKVVHIDIDPAEIGKNMETELPIVGDAKQILGELAEQAIPGETGEWVEYLTQLRDAVRPKPLVRPGFLEPRAFIRALSDKMQDDAVLVTDVGQNQIWAANHYEVRRGRFLTSGGMGTMGYSIPAALGAACAQRGRQIVVVCGDGAFQMSMMELATIMQYGLDVKIVIMRNDRLGMVYELQTKLYKCRYVATTLVGSPDFIALGHAYGIAGAHLNDNSLAEETIEKMLSHKGPYLLECSVSPDEGSM
jgi:acetolactate synthase-1/2/3 large subunit